MTVGTNFLEEGGGNINNQLVTDVFSQASGGLDAFYQLKEDSTAFEAGFSDQDIGIWMTWSICPIRRSGTSEVDPANRPLNGNWFNCFDFRSRSRSIS